jgi:copper homeostasis protein
LGILCEIAVDSLGGCRAAAQGGAQRIELSSALEVGGVTPGAGLLELACQRSALPVIVLVRPRAGDFVYDRGEFETMERDIVHARQAGAAGVALGVLMRDGRVDRERTLALIERARPMSVTFHRAFDTTDDLDRALRVLFELGVERVLTSGGAESALAGCRTLARLKRIVHAQGSKLSVVPAGGIRPSNLARILAASGAREVHASARGLVPGPPRTRPSIVRLAASVVAGDAESARTDTAVVRRLVECCARPAEA